MSNEQPRKMKQDAIVEALLEIRFNSSEIGEIVVGRLSDIESWDGGSTNRLPNADIPNVIRSNDPALHSLPIIEKQSADRTRAIRIGPQVMSYHMYAPYLGGDVFEGELNDAITYLFKTIKDIQINRIGFRYINFLTASKHEIQSLDDLTLKLTVGGGKINESLNLGFVKKYSEEHIVVNKVTTPDFIRASGVAPQDLISVIDIDVSTPDGLETSDKEYVFNWISKAREYEKDAFFSFFPKELKERLTEE